MNRDQRVLACVDQSHFADTVAEYAAWAAKRMGAPLEFLHVIDRHPEVGAGGDRSGTLGLDARKRLLDSLSDRDSAQSIALREAGREFLNTLRERALDLGVANPDVRQRHGSLEETLADLQDEVRLFVFGRRGASAELTQRDLGRNVEAMVRALSKPILAVTEGFREPERILVAFDGGNVTRRGLEMLAQSPLFKGLDIHVLMSGKARADAERQLAWAKDTLKTGGFEATTSLEPGDPDRVIAAAVAERKADILVMGAYAHARWRRILFSSRTNDLLRSATIPTLLLR